MHSSTDMPSNAAYLQSGQTDVTVFEGYICEIYEDVNGSSAQEDTVEVLPTKKASRGLLRAELPLRPTKLPVRTAPREHHTDASNSHPDPPHPSGIGVSKEQAKPVSSHSAPFAGCAAQQCMNERKGYRSGAPPSYKIYGAILCEYNRKGR